MQVSAARLSFRDIKISIIRRIKLDYGLTQNQSAKFVSSAPCTRQKYLNGKKILIASFEDRLHKLAETGAKYTTNK